MIANDLLSLVFIGCFLFGIVYLLITALLGGIGHNVGHHITHHAVSHTHTVGHTHAIATMNQSEQAHSIHTGHSHYHHNGDGFSILSILNPTSVVLFLFGFGFFGYVLHNATDLTLPIILLISGGIGIVIAALILVMFARIFGDSEAATVQDISDRTGLLGKVNITIPEHEMGEILYVSPGGMRKSVPARSVDGRRLERDQEVVVVSFQNGVAEVDTWDHFVNQEEAPAILAPEDDDLATLRALLDGNENVKSDNDYIMRNDTQKE